MLSISRVMGRFCSAAFLWGGAAAFVISSAAVSQEPSSALRKADAAYRAGQAALSQKDLSTAQADFEQVVRLAPQAEQGHSALGAVLASRGHLQEGIRELQKALLMHPSDSAAQMNLALAFEQTGAAAKALPLFSKLESAARTQHRELPASVLAVYARALAQAHHAAQAEIKMKAAIASDPRNPELHDELGSLYAQQKDWPHAQQEFAAAARLNPNSPVTHLHLGLAMRAQGQVEGLSELTTAAQLDPQNAIIALELGQALAADGHDEQAIPVFQHVLELEPDSAEGDYQLALALQRSNQVRQAIVLLKKVVAAEPNNADAMTNLGMAMCEAQLAKNAVPVLQRATDLAPENVTAHQDLAAAYVQLSQFADAVRELRTALKLAPDLPQLHYNLGLALKYQDDAAGAIPELETAEKLNPTGAEAPYLLGILYMQAGRYAEASREMNIALKLHPQNADGWATLGSVDEKLNKLPEAAIALGEAIRQDPSQSDAHLTLASVLARENRPDQARAERSKAADLMRVHMNLQRAEVATNAGNALLKSGDIAGSIVQFQNALSYDANYADAHRGLANALERQGKATEAAAERRKAESAKAAPGPR
jgi:tetratricopeptide (TPR) repeat protein